MKVYFYTLGCRVNQYETDAVRQVFIKEGYEIVDSPELADVCVVNTCTVTGEADRKSRQQLRKMARINPDAIICAMGCSTEMNGDHIDADVVCGTRDKHLICEKIKDFVASNKAKEHKGKLTEKTSLNEGFADFGTVLSPEMSRAYIKIEDGCNSFCTYCIIPYARGRVVSRSEESVLEEVTNVASRGIREVCITGIHLCSYGKDRGEDIMSLYSLIHKVGLIDGVDRISLGSLEPKSLTDEFIKALSTEKKLCKHFHLSLQSGSDTVLKRMNRHYNTDEYYEITRKLRKAFPDMSLTTDIICGFPQETDEEFQETLEFVKKVGLNKVHVFPYSVRKGTKAAGMPQVPADIAKERTRKLIALSDEREKEFSRSFIGKEVDVMIEKVDLVDGVFELKGYTGEYVYAVIRKTEIEKDPKEYIGSVIRGRGTGVEGTILTVS